MHQQASIAHSICSSVCVAKALTLTDIVAFTSYTTGAGHGGTGGHGSNQPTVGSPFGHIFEPSDLGCHGGGASGGLGGGRLVINVNDTLKIDGEISVNGGDALDSAGGGGSAGSIDIHTNLMQVRMKINAC